MALLWIVLPSVLVALAVLLLIVGAAVLRTDTTVRDRFNAYMSGASTEQVTLEELELARPFSERVLVPILKQIARLFRWMWPKHRMHLLRRRLAMAGNPGGLGASDFVGIKGSVMVLLIGGGVLTAFLAGYPLDFYAILLLLVLGVCGFFVPDVWLSRQISERKELLIRSLPDALDMLTITIEAGLSFESALQEIVSKWHDELSREFARVLREIGMGKTRRLALTDLSERTGVSDIFSLVTALNQAEELGVSIGRVLAAQSEDLRVRRRQRAQEQANKTPIKMLFPMVFLIFPSIFAVLLGPAIPNLLNLFK